MKLPVTRYYGSKRRVVEEIWFALKKSRIEFDTFLDLFGGTGILLYDPNKADLSSGYVSVNKIALWKVKKI